MTLNQQRSANQTTGFEWLKKFCYINSDDPRVFVCGKEQCGITVNLAHPISYVIIGFAIVGYVAGGQYFDANFGLGWAGMFFLAYSLSIVIVFYLLYKIDKCLHQSSKK